MFSWYTVFTHNAVHMDPGEAVYRWISSETSPVTSHKTNKQKTLRCLFVWQLNTDSRRLTTCCILIKVFSFLVLCNIILQYSVCLYSYYVAWKLGHLLFWNSNTLTRFKTCFPIFFSSCFTTIRCAPSVHCGTTVHQEHLPYWLWVIFPM